MRMTLAQWRDRLGGLFHRRAKKAKTPPTRRPLTRYKATIAKRTYTVKALTKSEARAQLKRLIPLGLIPYGTRLVEA